MSRRLSPLLGLLAVLLHCVALFIVIPKVSRHATTLYNQDRFIDGYDELAENLVRGNGYRFYPDTARTMMREPGYPIFLAGLMFLFGSIFTAVKLANVCLALATSWLITRLAARFSDSPILITLPPLLFLFHPATLIAESRGGVEILFTFLLVLFFLALYAARERVRGDWLYYALAGAVLGLTVLVRSTPILFPLFLLGHLLAFERRRTPGRVMGRNIAVMIVAMFAVLSPWIIRNYGLSGRFVPTASVLGISAHAGEYICAHRSESAPWYLLDREAAQERTRIAGDLGYRFREGYYYQAFYRTADELSFSSILAHRVFAEYEKNPLLCAKCMSLNLFNFWFAGKTWMSTALNVVVQLPYLLFAAIGTLRCTMKKQFFLIGPLVTFILYVMAVHVPILAQARYSAPLIPFLSILACFTLVARAQSIHSAVAEAAPEDAARACSPALDAKLAPFGTEKR